MQNQRIKFFTIQFQLNLSGLNNDDKGDVEYQYKLSNENQEIFIIYPTLKDEDDDGYRKIETWGYCDEKGQPVKNNKLQKNISSTKPTLIQFMAKTKNNDYENDFEISFRVKYRNKNMHIDFEPLINDQKIIPNTSYILYPINDVKQSNSKLYVILNSQKSFNISLYSRYTGVVIDEKDESDSTDPKYYEIYFLNQGQEYILYRSEIRCKKYRWSPFNFRYLNLSNPKIFIRFYYYGKQCIVTNEAPTVREYIEFSCRSNSYKEFFKYKTKSKPIDEYIENCCQNDAKLQSPDQKHFFIFPFIQKSPLDIQKIQAIQKIGSKNHHIFISANEINQSSYELFSQLAKIFMNEIGFNSNVDSKKDTDKYLIKTVETIKGLPQNYDFLIRDKRYESYLNAKNTIRKEYQQMIDKEISLNDTFQMQRNKQFNPRTSNFMSNVQRITFDNRNVSRPQNNKRKGKNKYKNYKGKEEYKNKKGVKRVYQVLMIYDHENDSDSDFDYKRVYEELKELLNFKCRNTENEQEQETYLNQETYSNQEIYSIAGEKLKNINKGIYNLSKSYIHYEITNSQKKFKTDKKKEKYSNYPVIIVTLVRKNNQKDTKLKFWSKICSEYSFIKLICVKENENHQYSNQFVLKYLSELKSIYDIIIKWTSQINFNFPIQMRIDPNTPNSLSFDYETIYRNHDTFIRRRLLELMSFDFNGWAAKKGHYTIFNYYYWKNRKLIMPLREKEFNKNKIVDKIAQKLGKINLALDANNNKSYRQYVYATILAAATSILYHHRGGDPYSEPCLIFALNWIRNQELGDKNEKLIDESAMEDMIITLNQVEQSSPKTDKETDKSKT